MAIKLKLEGFDELFKKIEKAGGSIDNAAETCMKKSADIMQEELKNEMQKAGVTSHLISEMPQYEIEKENNRISASVGYKKDEYNPKKPSNAYKVIFLNYGTPKRSKHGKVKARGFIQKAKRKATPKIKKQQEETLNEILKELK